MKAKTSAAQHVQVHTEALDDQGRHPLAFIDHAQQEMLRADVVVVELESLAKGKFKDLFGPRSERLRSGGKASNRPDLLLHLPAHRFQGHPAALQGLGGEAIALVHEAEQDVLGTDETMVEEPCFYLCQHEDAPGSVGEALKHGPSLPGLRRPPLCRAVGS